MEQIITIVIILLAVVGGFSIVAAFTPNQSDNAIVQKVWSTINVLGANFFNAANKIKGAISS